MSYTKKTWKNRISEYPTRRILKKTDGTSEEITVTRSEGDVSQEGDAFSAENMNDFEERVASGFNELTASLTNENSEIFIYGYKNGVRGYYTDPSKADDSFIPFNTGKDILPEMIKHQDYTIPSERFLLELVGYRNMYSQSSGINRYALNGADVEKEIGRYFCAICNSGYSCVSGNVGVLKLICRGTPGNKIAPVVYFNESNGAKGDAARMINWIVTMTPLMEE